MRLILVCPTPAVTRAHGVPLARETEINAVRPRAFIAPHSASAG